MASASSASAAKSKAAAADDAPLNLTQVSKKLGTSYANELKIYRRLLHGRVWNGKYASGVVMNKDVQEVLKAEFEKLKNENESLRKKLAAHDPKASRARSLYRGLQKNGNNGWAALVTDKSVRHYCGTFQEEKEAALAWDLKVLELKGRRCIPTLNFPNHKDVKAKIATLPPLESSKTPKSYHEYRGVVTSRKRLLTGEEAKSNGKANMPAGFRTPNEPMFINFEMHHGSRRVATFETAEEAAQAWNECAYVMGQPGNPEVSMDDILNLRKARSKQATDQLIKCAANREEQLQKRINVLENANGVLQRKLERAKVKHEKYIEWAQSKMPRSDYMKFKSEFLSSKKAELSGMPKDEVLAAVKAAWAADPRSKAKDANRRTKTPKKRGRPSKSKSKTPSKRKRPSSASSSKSKKSRGTMKV